MAETQSIDTLAERTLTHAVGHDADGLAGREAFGEAETYAELAAGIRDDGDGLAVFGLSQGANVASAGTITLGDGGYFHVTGTTTITDIDFTDDWNGREVTLVFDGILTLTHHATTLILPTGASITTAAGDSCVIRSEGSDVVRVVSYQRKSGAALASSGSIPFTAASGSGAASLEFAEDTDNGAHKVTLKAPASLSGDIDVTLPSAAGTVLTSADLGKVSWWIPASAMVPRTTSGAGLTKSETTTNKVILDCLAFDTAADEFAQFVIQMPKSWDEGTITAQFVWSQASTNATASVCWAIQAGAFANDDASDTAFETAVTVSDDGGTGGDIYISSRTSAVTVAGSPGAEELVVFQVYRDVDGNGTAGDDDLAQDALLIGVTIQITVNALKDD